jgi:hypothetical protein
MSFSQLTSSHLKVVAKLIKKKDGLLAKVKVIDDELESFMTGDAPKSERVPRRKRRKMSPEGRAKIAAAQKKRWAKPKGA